MQLLESSSVFFSISYLYLYTMFEFELHLLYKYFLNNDIYTKNNTKFSIRGTKEKKIVLNFLSGIYFFFSGSWRSIFCVTFCESIIVDIFFVAESEMTTEGRVSSFTTFTAIPPVNVENIRYTHLEFQ